MRAPVLAVLATAAVTLVARRADAEPALPCVQAEPGSVEIDGMLDDWKGVARARAGGATADASFDLRCLFDGERVYLAVDVRDEKPARRPRFDKAHPDGDDHLRLELAGLALTVVPGVDGIAPVRLLAGKKPVDKAIAIEDTLQARGWSVELAIPVARLTGWTPSVPALPARVVLRDSDVPKAGTTEHEVVWAGGLGFGQAGDLLAGLLADARLSKGQITLDARAEVDRSSAGPERVIAGGDVLALITDRYAFVKLPVAKPADVLKVELVDLRGDGSRLIAAHLRQRSGDHVREVLTFWTGGNGTLQQIYALELGKAHGGSRLRSTWTTEPAKGWKQAKGARRVVVVRAQPAVGWDEDSYAEPESTDAEPVHVPWDDDRVGGVFWLDRNGMFATAPIRR